jgi:hypothetical protein
MTTDGRTRRRPLHAVAAAATLLPAALSAIPAEHRGAPTCGVHCGTERWTIKTLSDDGAAQVNLTPQQTTVSQLVSIPAPDLDSDDARAAPTEMQAVTVTAELVGYKEELGAKGDHDFHIVIEEPTDSSTGPKTTMIVEIPDPDCSGVCNSVARGQIEAARAAFSSDVLSPPTAKFAGYASPVPVVVTGVPLFDFYHGQTGVARNCIEIHPVLSITFPNGPPKDKPVPGLEPKPLGSKDDYSCIAE